MRVDQRLASTWLAANSCRTSAQDGYIGFRLLETGLFLQPRRKLPLRLGFYNATFGVWEQWAVRRSTEIACLLGL